jgi:hypothetical protein
MVEPVAAGRDSEFRESYHLFQRAARARARERTALAFIGLLALTFTTLTGTVATVLLW